MEFTPDTMRQRWQAHSAWAKTADGLKIKVTCEGETVRVSAYADGLHSGVEYTRAEARALAAELLAAADAHPVKEAA